MRARTRRHVREKLRLKSGQKLTVVTKGGVIYFIPEKPIGAFRGFLKGMDTGDIRAGQIMFLVDSSGWIEFCTDGQFAEQYSKYIKTPSRIITPTVVFYEVYKKIKKERTEEEALIAVSHQGQRRLLVRWEYHPASILCFVQLAALCILLKQF